MKIENLCRPIVTAILFILMLVALLCFPDGKIKFMENDLNISSIVQCILAFFACVLAYIIPKRIMWEQTYSSLISDYRSTEFGAAYQGVIEFFVKECNSSSNIGDIKTAYQQRFILDMYEIDSNTKGKSGTEQNEAQIFEQIKEKYKDSKKYKDLKLKQTSSELCLHYQRRMLAQFFYQLDLCAGSGFLYIKKKRIRRDFTQSEANMVRILILMGKAIEKDEKDGDGILWKNINCDYHVRPPKYEKGMNTYLCDLYKLLKKAERFMEGV